MLPKVIKSGKPVNSPRFMFQQADMGEEGGQAPINHYSEDELPAGSSEGMGMLEEDLGAGGGGGVDVSTIISRAQADARRVVEAAREEAAQIEREAYDKGFEEGRKSGELMANQQLQAILHRYHASLTALDGLAPLLVEQLQLDFLDMVTHTAEKVIKTELQLRPATILPIVKSALLKLKQRQGLTIFLNPDDHGFVIALAKEEQQQIFGNHVELEIAPELEQGSVRIETKAGELDATVATKLDLVRQNLESTLQENV